jgi:unsaturated rhamnogalacturonyl hydrolase
MIASIRLPALCLVALSVSLAGCRTATSSLATAPEADLKHWPAGLSPQAVGKRVAENFVQRKFRFETGETPRASVVYPEVCAGYGALTLAQLAGDADLQQRLVAKFAVFLAPENAPRLPNRPHVDDTVFGVVPLELYRQTRDRRYLEIGLRYADGQWKEPTPDGITAEARYWIDDMFMITAVQVQAFRATGERRYLDRAAVTMAAYLDRLQQPNGLFFHTADSPFFWARGNGWFAAGMAELLRDLPADHPHRARILAGYHQMMATLLRTQGADGLWRQLIDKPETWPETSATGMFAFAIVTGVKHGWLDAASYAPAARRAWLGLVGYVDADANVREVCVGTNKAANVVGPALDAQYRFYVERPRHAGDLHGQAPLLWTAAALLR